MKELPKTFPLKSVPKLVTGQAGKSSGGRKNCYVWFPGTNDRPFWSSQHENLCLPGKVFKHSGTPISKGQKKPPKEWSDVHRFANQKCGLVINPSVELGHHTNAWFSSIFLSILSYCIPLSPILFCVIFPCYLFLIVVHKCIYVLNTLIYFSYFIILYSLFPVFYAIYRFPFFVSLTTSVLSVLIKFIDVLFIHPSTLFTFYPSCYHFPSYLTLVINLIHPIYVAHISYLTFKVEDILNHFLRFHLCHLSRLSYLIWFTFSFPFARKNVRIDARQNARKNVRENVRIGARKNARMNAWKDAR